MTEIQFGENTFCGPSAIAALVGCNTDTAEFYIQQVIGTTRRIKGVTNEEIVKTLDLLGYDCERFEIVEDSTLFGSIPYIATRNGCYLVTIPGHFITLETKGSRVTLLDNHTKTPLNIAASARLGQRIERCWKVIQREAKPVKEITYSRRKITLEIEVDRRLLTDTASDNLLLLRAKDTVRVIVSAHPAYSISNGKIETIMEPDE